ncbi:hypothetical protein [Flammeovirga aprica]|uniref:Uncharacterized protein n=1 Tax=Flammeovirga aprica JL-4 TaxID=694437 RepID=A0A7X9S033_9BACT|nr:hypothetical protein [Flammeovirga aprica]NME71870.1 hypothetical protein [Flammeovirga aprica JL-4]
MKSPTTSEQEEALGQIYEYAANLIINEKKSPSETKAILIDQGMEEELASALVDNIKQQIEELKSKKSKDDMLYGALWCVGGIIATVADIGFIFWGAILFGGIQFLKGLFRL